jgi:hypothetical protein
MDSQDGGGPDLTRPFNHASRSVLNHRHIERFEGDSLFARLARAVCAAECLPRKELYEAWEVARRVRRRMRGGRVVDLAAGHGLLAWTLILLDDTTPDALCVDTRRPKSAGRLEATLTERWPRLSGRVCFEEAGIGEAEIRPGDLAASVHGCGELTDQVLDAAIAARARVAVLPCCHALARCDTGKLEGWVDGPLAVDLTRAARLRGAGYRVHTARIPEEITPMNRLLMGWPPG